MTETNPLHIDRRSFFVSAGVAAGAAILGRQAQAKEFGDVVSSADFARIEKLGPGVWAAVSTPLDANGALNPRAIATLCNGGVIAGKDRVVVIDGFFQPAGAAWLAKQAQELTGRPVTDVIVTHFHADHTGGLAGFINGAQSPEIIATDTTRKLIFERYAGPVAQDGSPFAKPAIRPILPTQIITDETSPTTFDLGGRVLTLHPKRGHTPSDLAITVDDAPVTFAGDLVWAGFFHNYVDAIPSALRKSVGELLKDKEQIIVTGHGYVAKAGDLKNYLDLLDHVEDGAKAAYKAGKTPKEGAADFTVPDSLGEWELFNPAYYEVAFEAWRRELAGESG
ncbi:MAG: MBL fold metallo-hydrolase [Pseudomonadota bacterium]